MTAITRELAPPSPSFRSTPAGESLAHAIGFSVCEAHIHGGSSVKSGFDPGTFWPRNRDLNTMPPRPLTEEFVINEKCPSLLNRAT
ncbi:hypothetical protein AVEN_221317-1 [Araneus ventricosus]|uniref:Uncharacterized protein n=1 Tax=Araneus ventricosus TaxID=182803 RepID=A0A4Y2AYC3_ARAVE|nr:hypothetical protein AVEN_221317-1 [Araneus ventricosus]